MFCGSNDHEFVFSWRVKGKPVHFRNFDLDSITVLQNGYPIAGTPLQTDNDKQLYLNSLEALAFSSHERGNPIDDFPDHYVLVFDLTSTQHASHVYLYPELTNGSFSIDLRFSKDIPDSLELFFSCERSSTTYISSAADSFLLALDRNFFVILNSAKAEAPGTHWLRFCNREDVFAFGDSLGL